MDTEHTRHSSQQPPLQPSEDDYRAVAGYRAQCDGELSLHPGDAVSSVKPLGNGWSLGRVARAGCPPGAVGIFPSACVEREAMFEADVTSAQFGVAPLGTNDVTTEAGGISLECGAASCVKCTGSACDSLGYGSTSARPSKKSTQLVLVSGEQKPRMIVKPSLDPASSTGQGLQRGLHHWTSRPGGWASQTGWGPQQGGTEHTLLLQRRPSSGRSPNNNDHQVQVTHDCTSDAPLQRKTVENPYGTNPSWMQRDCMSPSEHAAAQCSEEPMMVDSSPEMDTKLPDCCGEPTPRSVDALCADRAPPTTTRDEPLGVPSESTREVRDAERYRISRERGAVGCAVGGGSCPDCRRSAGECGACVDIGLGLLPGKHQLPKSTPPRPPASSACHDQATAQRSAARVHPRQRGNQDPNSSIRFAGHLPPAGECTSFRLAGSAAIGSLFGLVVFILAYYQLDYGAWVSVGTAGWVAVGLGALLAVSRLCRCVLAVLLPSVCTGRGRIAYTGFMIGCLLGGPVTNVYVNLQQVSRSMSCSAERSYNQTLLLLQPFDAMMLHVNRTMAGLQDAARDVWLGLSPLAEGLGDVESDVYNGRIQLMGTGKTCRTLIDRAHNSCVAGILSARDQCLGVIGALGSVYHHARDILDTLNPGKWAPRQSVHDLHDPPEELEGRTFGERSLPADDSDICEPLSTLTVCNNLNDSGALCQPSTWAGDAIQDAINATRRAMAGLRQALHFSVTSEPYQAARANASALVFRIRQSVQEEFAQKTGGFLAVTEVLMKLAPLSVMLLVYAGYRHVRMYVSVDDYDNLYVNERFKAVDQQRCLACNGGMSLMPLKRYELKYLADTSDWKLSEIERRMCWSGLCVFFLQLLITSFCFSFDLILYWVLSLVGKYGSFGFEVTGGSGDSELGMVVTGEGLIVDLLDVFLSAFHPTQWPGYAAVAHSCLPEPRAPSVVTAATMLLLHLTLLLSIVCKARVFRIRDEVTGYFYPERAERRTVQLYRVVLAQRLALKSRLRKVARINYSAAQTKRNCTSLSRLLVRIKICRRAFATSNRCVVCGLRGGVEKFFVCLTQHCRAVYCKECITDSGDVCAVCCTHEAQQDDSNSCDCIEDGLLMYSLISRRHNDF